MEKYEVVGRIIVLLLGLYLIFKSSLPIFVKDNSLIFFSWIYLIIIFLVGIFLIYNSVKGILFKKEQKEFFINKNMKNWLKLGLICSLIVFLIIAIMGVISSQAEHILEFGNILRMILGFGFGAFISIFVKKLEKRKIKWGVVGSIGLILIEMIGRKIFWSSSIFISIPFEMFSILVIGFIIGVFLSIIFEKDKPLWKKDTKDIMKAVKASLMVLSIQLSSVLALDILHWSWADISSPFTLTYIRLPFKNLFWFFNQELGIPLLTTIIYSLIIFCVCFLGVKIFKKLEKRKILYSALFLVLLILSFIGINKF